MAHLVTLPSGRHEIVFDLTDAYRLVEDTMGEEFWRELQDLIQAEQEEHTADLEYELEVLREKLQ